MQFKEKCWFRFCAQLRKNWGKKLKKNWGIWRIWLEKWNLRPKLQGLEVSHVCGGTPSWPLSGHGQKSSRVENDLWTGECDMSTPCSFGRGIQILSQNFQNPQKKIIFGLILGLSEDGRLEQKVINRRWPDWRIHDVRGRFGHGSPLVARKGDRSFLRDLEEFPKNGPKIFAPKPSQR